VTTGRGVLVEAAESEFIQTVRALSEIREPVSATPEGLRNVDARPLRVLWVTFDFPPRLSSGVFRPVKIYKYVDKRYLTIDFITHGAAARFQNAVLDESLLAEVSPPPRVVRVRTPVLHDSLPALVARLRQVVRRRPTSAPSEGPLPSSAEHQPARRHSEGAPPRGLGAAIYRRLAMCLYFPDHLFLWGHFAAATAVWMHLRRRYDVIYTTSYPESAHLPGFLLHALGVPWVVDYRYGGPLWIKKLVGFDKPRLRERLDLLFQRTAMRWSDRVITQSEPMRADFCHVFGLDPSKVDVIASGYDDEDFTRVDRAASPYAKQPHEVHLLHVGVMDGTSADERRQLVDALSRLADGLRTCGRELVVHAVGKDLFSEALRTGARFEYRHHGTVVHRHLPPYLCFADCYLLSTLTTSTGHDHVRGFIPGKVWEYLRAGKPIVMIGPKDEIWSIIDEAGVGLQMDLHDERPLSPEALLRALDTVRPLHPKVQSYSWQSRARSLQHVFQHVTGAAQAEPRKGQVRA
jgi:glycosyltransferase involved in cell wall biosynthesis